MPLKETNKSLQVGIVGARIAGLTTAIALLDGGHDVEIYERSQFKEEVGAAIIAPPKSSRILAHYGVDPKRSKATVAEIVIIYPDPNNLTKDFSMPVTHFGTKYKAPWYFFHRVDLHNELRKLATEPNPTRQRVARIHLATEVSRVEFDGTIVFRNDTQVKKDVVIAADGIRASFLPTILGQNLEAEHRMSMLRFMVPTENLDRDPETQALFKDRYPSLRITYSGDKSVVLYGCREDTLLNVGILFPVTSIQDASARAQGASMAIEDAAALGILLSDMDSKDDIPARLKQFDELRVPRVAATQIISAMHQRDPSKVKDEEKHFFNGRIAHK
ncbi:Ff.00g065910.m01.CDS01 [Fusarium sp. VM40]|nr:Ff.00g065910.m01.CDS01 [Fusarium sp. VM40]